MSEIVNQSLQKTFLQAKTFTKKCLRHFFLLRKKKYFFGKAFFKPFRKAFTEIASQKERFVISGSAQCSGSYKKVLVCVSKRDCSVRTINAVAHMIFFRFLSISEIVKRRTGLCD